MPAHQLPWFKFWKGATAHRKVRQLDDPTFRTWVESLDWCAQQPHRGRFKDRKEAASITRRPVKHFATLIGLGLIDESTEALVMHDWEDWQRWRKDDVNDTGTTTESPPERPPNDQPNDTGTTSEQPTDQHANDFLPSRPPLVRGEKRDERVKTEDERRVNSVAAVAASPGGVGGGNGLAELHQSFLAEDRRRRRTSENQREGDR